MTKRKRTTLIVAVTLLLGVITFFAYPTISDYVFKRYIMHTELPEIWKELDSGKIEAGSSLAKLMETYPPPMEIRYGRFTVLGYHDAGPGEIAMSGINVVAKNDIVIQAIVGHEYFSHTFFDIMTDEEEEELNAKEPEFVIKNTIHNNSTAPNPSGPVR